MKPLAFAHEHHTNQQIDSTQQVAAQATKSTSAATSCGPTNHRPAGPARALSCNSADSKAPVTTLHRHQRTLGRLTLSALAVSLLGLCSLSSVADAVPISSDAAAALSELTLPQVKEESSLRHDAEPQAKSEMLAAASHPQNKQDASPAPAMEQDYGRYQVEPLMRPHRFPEGSNGLTPQSALPSKSMVPVMVADTTESRIIPVASLSPAAPESGLTQLFSPQELSAAAATVSASTTLAANQSQVNRMLYSPEQNRNSVQGAPRTYAALTAHSARPAAAPTAATSATAARAAALPEPNTVRITKTVSRSMPMTLSKINLLSTAKSESPAIVTGAKERLNEFLGRPIDANLLNRVLNQVTRYYQEEQGLKLAQAYLPAQSITNGELSLVVASPTIDEIEVINASRVSDDYLDYLLSDIKAQEGAPLNYEELQSRMLRLSDAGVVHLIGGVDALNEMATSRKLRLGVVDFYHPLAFSLFADNYGNESSGRYRFGGQMQVTNLLGLADKLSLFYARTDEEQNNYSLNYELPVTPHGTRLGLNFSFNDYELGGWYRELGAKGNSFTVEGYVHEPLYRDTISSVNLRAGLRYRELEDEFSAFDLTFNKHTFLGYTEFNGFKFFGKRQQHLFSFMQRFSWGHLTNDDDWGLWEDHDYVISNTNLNFRYELNEHLTAATDFTMQLADTSLEGSEQFSASGPYGLKAFASSDLSGDSGVVLSEQLEISPWNPEILNIIPHVEIGHIDNKGYKGDSGASAGLTLHYNTSFGLSLELDYSHTIGPRPEFAEDDGRINFTIGYFYL